jgi:hypothetical protein
MPNYLSRKDLLRIGGKALAYSAKHPIDLAQQSGRLAGEIDEMEPRVTTNFALRLLRLLNEEQVYQELGDEHLKERATIRISELREEIGADRDALLIRLTYEGVRRACRAITGTVQTRLRKG